MKLLCYFEYHTTDKYLLISFVSIYENVKSNARCTCSGDLTYCDRNTRYYNEFWHGKKKERRNAKFKKDMYNKSYLLQSN